MLDVMPVRAALLNSAGIILFANAPWREFVEENQLDSQLFAVGGDYLRSEWGGDAGGTNGSSIRTILSGEKKSVVEEYACSCCGESGWFILHAVPITLPEGAIGVVVTHHQITDRKLAEERVREQAALLDEAHDAIVVVDCECRVRYWNKGAERLHGWTATEVVGRSTDEFLYPDVSFLLTARETVLREGLWQGELRHLTKGGEEVEVQSRWNLVRDEQGNPKSIFCVTTDLTELKEQEARIMRAQRMENIGSLAGGVAHDLNNILSPILMGIEVLKLKLTGAEDRLFLDTLEATAKRGENIVRQVLSLDRGSTLGEQRVDPKDLVEDLERIVRQTFLQAVQLSVTVLPDVWRVNGDAAQLHQALLSLCVNARDAMPQGGALTIRVTNIVLDSTEAATRRIQAPPGKYVLFQVADTGPGIPAEIQERIFDPVFTTKSSGTGLGLPTVASIIKNHHGFIDLHSAVGRGTIFRIYLPALVQAGGSHGPAPAPQLARGHGEGVLLVDDEPAIRTVGKQTLETYGYTVIPAADGVEAVALFVQNEEKIDVVVTDLIMPNMDGVALIFALKKLAPKLPIVAATGFANEAQIRTALEAGAERLLSKPYNAETLLNAVRDMLANASL